MGILRLLEVLTRQGSGPSSVGVHAPEGTSGVGRVDEDVLLSPTSAAGSQYASQDLGRSSRYWDLLQLGAGEKCDVGVVRRPKRILGTFGSLEAVGDGRADTLHEQDAFP